jgi:predicted cobalt transporter CbtA
MKDAIVRLVSSKTIYYGVALAERGAMSWTKRMCWGLAGAAVVATVTWILFAPEIRAVILAAKLR